MVWGVGVGGEDRIVGEGMNVGVGEGAGTGAAVTVDWAVGKMAEGARTYPSNSVNEVIVGPSGPRSWRLMYRSAARLLPRHKIESRSMKSGKRSGDPSELENDNNGKVTVVLDSR